MPAGTATPSPFQVKDCAIAAIATGMRAQTLREMRNFLKIIDLGSIYYHFWGWRLRPVFHLRDFYNDFSLWAAHGLDDLILAERLGAIDPGEFDDLEQLRREVIDVIEERLDEIDHVPWAKLDRQFHFIRAQIVVFRTENSVQAPEDFPQVIPRLSLHSIFYHFIDSRHRRLDRSDDFRAWLAGWGEEYRALRSALRDVDPHFFSLSELRQELAWIFRHHIGEALLRRNEKGQT